VTLVENAPRPIETTYTSLATSETLGVAIPAPIPWLLLQFWKDAQPDLEGRKALQSMAFGSDRARGRGVQQMLIKKPLPG
jgi:hypothetical protein